MVRCPDLYFCVKSMVLCAEWECCILILQGIEVDLVQVDLYFSVKAFSRWLLKELLIERENSVRSTFTMASSLVLTGVP